MKKVYLILCLVVASCSSDNEQSPKVQYFLTLSETCPEITNSHKIQIEKDQYESIVSIDDFWNCESRLTIYDVNEVKQEGYVVDSSTTP